MDMHEEASRFRREWHHQQDKSVYRREWHHQQDKSVYLASSGTSSMFLLRLALHLVQHDASVAVRKLKNVSYSRQGIAVSPTTAPLGWGGGLRLA